MDRDDLDLDGLLSSLQGIQGAMAESTQRMAIETADAWSRDEMVHVWVNARGVVIQTEIDEDLFSRAGSAEVAASFVEAAQSAAARIGEKVQAFQAGLWQQIASAGLPDVRQLTEIDEFQQLQPPIPVSPPDSRERRAVAEALQAEHPTRQRAESDEWRPNISDQG